MENLPKISMPKISKSNIILIGILLLALITILGTILIFVSPFIVMYFYFRWQHKRKYTKIINNKKQ
ncbi:MAG: hypothetical protein ACK5B9_03650 [Flavobacteriia bacterium]|jgi:hypothetical protein